MDRVFKHRQLQSRAGPATTLPPWSVDCLAKDLLNQAVPGLVGLQSEVKAGGSNNSIGLRTLKPFHELSGAAVLTCLRYYGPFKRMTEYGPVFCDIRDEQARKEHKAVSCPDKILTAFCQLGALRMNARRALIFFFDIKHAYVMAEATRTLSLEDDSTHDPGDQLWSKCLQY